MKPKRHAWITESVSEGWRCRIRRRRRSRPAPRDAGGDLVADGEVGLDAPDERETGRAAMGALGPRPSSRQIDTGLVLSRAARSEQELEPPQRVTLGRVEQPKGSDAVHALRRDMLQEALQHLLGRQGEDLMAVIAAVAVPEA